MVVRVPSEWAKREECWEAMRDLPFEFLNPLPPGFRICRMHGARGGAPNGKGKWELPPWFSHKENGLA
jgi:hypothetical protein